MKSDNRAIEITLWHDYGIIGIILGIAILFPSLLICLTDVLHGIELLVIAWLMPVGAFLISMGVKDVNQPIEYIMLPKKSYDESIYTDEEISRIFREHAMNVVEGTLKANNLKYSKSLMQKKFSLYKFTHFLDIRDRNIRIYLGRAKSSVSIGILIKIKSFGSKNKHNITQIESIIDEGLASKINTGIFANYIVVFKGVDL